MIEILRTPRLIVRRFALDDLDAFHAYRDDPEVARHQGWDAPFARAAAEALVHDFATGPALEPGQWTQFALERRTEPGLIGDVGVRLEAVEPTAELGFTIARGHWGAGYGREALRAVAAFLLDDLELERVVAFTHHENIAAIASLHAAGLIPVAVDGDDLVYYRARTATGSHRSEPDE